MNPEKATYILMVNVLYCDKKQENNAAGGAVAAGAVGAGVAGYNNGGAGGMAAAGLGAALIGGLIAKATEDTIYQMQVDIVIERKLKDQYMLQILLLLDKQVLMTVKKLDLLTALVVELKMLMQQVI